MYANKAVRFGKCRTLAAKSRGDYGERKHAHICYSTESLATIIKLELDIATITRINPLANIPRYFNTSLALRTNCVFPRKEADRVRLLRRLNLLSFILE